MINKTIAFDFLKQLEFERLAGSPEELKAANIIKDTAESFGGSCDITPFDITDGIVHQAEFEILEPYHKTYKVTGYKCCANTPEDGITADFIYAEDLNEANLIGAKGKIVLFNGYLRVPAYKTLIAAGVAGIVSFSGSLINKKEDNDFFTRKLRETLQHFGTLPAAHLDVHDAFEIVSKKATKARLKVIGETVTKPSHNVISTITGTTYPEQIICIGAHYDSTEFSKGVYDNGAGSVIIMELYKHFLNNPPMRTLRFAWFGAEEIGLKGSHAYVKDNDITNHIFMINVDVGGPVLGGNVCKLTASKELTAFCDMYMKITGHPIKVSQDIYSSDSIPFADNGIPAINFSRVGAEDCSFIHTRHDVMDYLSEDGLYSLVYPVLDITDKLVNSAVFPEKREIPTEIKEKVDKYLFKKEIEEATKDKEK